MLCTLVYPLCSRLSAEEPDRVLCGCGRQQHAPALRQHAARTAHHHYLKQAQHCESISHPVIVSAAKSVISAVACQSGSKQEVRKHLKYCSHRQDEFSEHPGKVLVKSFYFEGKKKIGTAHSCLCFFFLILKGLSQCKSILLIYSNSVPFFCFKFLYASSQIQTQICPL